MATASSCLARALELLDGVVVRRCHFHRHRFKAGLSSQALEAVPQRRLLFFTGALELLDRVLRASKMASYSES